MTGDGDLTEIPASDEAPSGPPPYDASAVGRVAARVQIQSVELLGAHFMRVDDEPLGELHFGDLAPEIGIHVEWRISDDRSRLSCAVAFSTDFPEFDPDPWEMLARFRLDYSVSEGEKLSDDDLNQFANWNAVFNAWPYWREYLSSTVSRAQLPQFVVPVIGVPRQSTAVTDDEASPRFQSTD